MILRGFKSIVNASIIAALILLVSNGIFVTTTYAADEYDTLRNKWKEVLTGGTAYDPLDPHIAGRIASITDRAQTLWDTMNKASGRTYLWSDVSSPTTTSHMTESYNRLREMAVAYATKGSTLENNADLLSDIVSALDWMYANRYNETKANVYNWWDWQIGVPLALNDIVVILYDQLTAAQITNYMNAVNKFTNSVVQTGANRVWECTIIAVRGIIVKDSGKIAAARDGLSDVLSYVTSGNGFYEDGSFIEHVKYSYNGGYGKALLSSISKVLYVLEGSTWTVTDPNKQNMYKWVYDSYEPLIYKGAVMDMTRGREISRYYGEDHVAGHDVIQSIIQIAQFAPAEDAAKFKSMVKYWIQADTYRDFFAYAPIYTIIKGKAIVDDPSVPSRGELVVNKQYPVTDRTVHLRPGFGFGISMSSNRIASFESINNENVKGWYTGDGMTYLYNNDLAQYSDGFWPTVNPYRLPGTTVDTQTRSTQRELSGTEYVSPKNWVGGTSIAGQYGVSGMELDAYGSTLTAKKSWFMFDNEIVALGSGITSTDGRTIETIVDNRKLNGSGNNALTVNGTIKSADLVWSESMSNVNWIQLAGNVPGADVGYYFPGGAAVKGLREARTGSWKAINADGPSDPITRNFMTLWLDHGANPVNGTYSYVILPNKTAAEVSSYAASPDIAILENSADAQAVKDTGLNVTGVNFWNDILKSVGGITSNKKASVMTKETAEDIEVAVSDPTQANTGAITIEINKPAYGILSKDSRITVTQLSPTIKMVVNVNGARGSTFKAKFGFNSGTPINPAANLALNKTVTASSSFSNSDWNLLNSVDGQRNSVTGSRGWSSNSMLTTNHTEWLQVDLGSEATVNRVDLYPRNDGVNTGYGFPADFAVQVSTDGTSWSTVASRTGYPLPGNGVQVIEFANAQARYVKVIGTSLRANPNDNNLYRMQLAEIELYFDPELNYNNLALNKTATASSTVSSSNWNLANAVDGERNSIGGKYGWTSNNNLTVNHTEWLKVDLGSAATVGRVDLYPRNDQGNVGYGFPADFTIQASADGTTWTTVVTRTGYPLPGNAVQSFGFSPVQARYIKVEGTNLRKNPNDNNLYRMQLAELEVYPPVQFDQTPPADPTFAADKTTPTNTDVIVTISYPSDALMKDYKVGAGGTWTLYTAPVAVSVNDAVYARGTDMTGNVSNATSYAVSNIDKTPPVTIASVSPVSPNGKSGWYKSDVTVSLAVYDDLSGPARTEYQVNDGAWTAYTGSIPAFGEGVYTVNYRSADIAGNIEQVRTIEFKIDKTPPTLIVQLDKPTLWPVNHQMVDINAILRSSDTLSGVASVELSAITSNEPDSGEGDIQAELGTPAALFRLRAERLGSGKGRIYTITYTITDRAGNSTNASATVEVPHDQSVNPQ